jgi:hypothetical protein
MGRKKKIVEHKIETIEDIFNVIDEDNFERFMMDFMLFIHQAGMIKKSHPEVKIQSMLWTDDGIHEITGCSLNNTVIFSKNKS